MLNCHIEVEGLLKVRGSHVLSKVVICQKRCKKQLFAVWSVYDSWASCFTSYYIYMFCNRCR